MSPAESRVKYLRMLAANAQTKTEAIKLYRQAAAIAGKLAASGNITGPLRKIVEQTPQRAVWKYARGLRCEACKTGAHVWWYWRNGTRMKIIKIARLEGLSEAQKTAAQGRPLCRRCAKEIKCKTLGLILE